MHLHKTSKKDRQRPVNTVLLRLGLLHDDHFVATATASKAAATHSSSITQQQQQYSSNKSHQETLNGRD
jgi:hypothetical protein